MLYNQVFNCLSALGRYLFSAANVCMVEVYTVFFLLPLVARCIYMAHVCFYVCCSDSVGVYGNVCCVSDIVTDSGVLALEC